MTDGVLATGWAPLTEFAADCALELIIVMRAAVLGEETNVTPTMQAAWRTHVAAYCAMLAPQD